MSDRGNNCSQSNNDEALFEELYKFCGSESLSEDGLRAIIEKHGIIAPNNPNINKYDFFHQACHNERISEEIIRYILEYFPNAIRTIGERGRLPLHSILCENKNVTLGMVQLLIDAFPDSLRHENINGVIPIDGLCENESLNEEVRLEILKLLLDSCPESVQHADTDGDLPIHNAARYQSPEFCRLLIEAYPGSEQITGGHGQLPFHYACECNAVATAKYLFTLYPESINVADNDGYPIHCAIWGLQHRINPAIAVEMIQFLLGCNSNVALHKYDGKLTLCFTCESENDIMEINPNQARWNAYLKVLQMIYDAHPGVIEDNQVTSNLGGFGTKSHAFVSTHLIYARQSRDQTLMTTRDENGQLPLHRVLRDNATLGSIKLLVKGNPSAICTFDNRGMIPLHAACQYHESASVVDYLIGLDSIAFRATDFEHNTALHFACRGAKYDTITLLLEKYGGIAISKRNSHNQLPIHLLLESPGVSDREDIKYMESIYRLLRAYPETVIGLKEEFNFEPESCSHSGKKRKFGTK